MSFEIVKINVFRIKATEFKANSWSSNGDYAIYVEYPGNNTLFLWKDGTIHYNSTGWAEVGRPEEFSSAAGYWKTLKEAKIFLAGWLSLSTPSTVMIIKHRQTEVLTIGEASWYQTYGPVVVQVPPITPTSRIWPKVRWGTWIPCNSRELILKTETSIPYVFQAGDVVEYSGSSNVGEPALPRIIVKDVSNPSLLVAVDVNGNKKADANEAYNPNFVYCHYKKIGELRDFLGD